MKVQREVVVTTVNEIGAAPNNNTANNTILHVVNKKLAGDFRFMVAKIINKHTIILKTSMDKDTESALKYNIKIAKGLISLSITPTKSRPTPVC